MPSHRRILKKLKKSTAIKEAVALDYNKDGSVQINVGLKEASEFYSPYSYLTYEFMNPAITNQIEMYESSIPLTENVSIDIYTETPTTQEDKKRIRRTVKRHYAEAIVSSEQEYKRNLWNGIIFSGIGIILLLFEMFLLRTLDNTYIDVILAVIGWLFLWDGCEGLLYECPAQKRGLIRQYRLLNAKVHVRNYSQKIKREYGIEDEEEEDEEEESTIHHHSHTSK